MTSRAMVWPARPCQYLSHLPSSQSPAAVHPHLPHEAFPSAHTWPGSGLGPSSYPMLPALRRPKASKPPSATAPQSGVVASDRPVGGRHASGPTANRWCRLGSGPINPDRPPPRSRAGLGLAQGGARRQGRWEPVPREMVGDRRGRSGYRESWREAGEVGAGTARDGGRQVR